MTTTPTKEPRNRTAPAAPAKSAEGERCPTPLKILLMSSQRWIQSGGAVQMAQLARALHERGHRVHCVYGADPAQREVFAAEFLRLAGPGPALHLFPVRGMAFWRSLGPFRRLLRAEGFQVLQTHKGPALTFALAACLGLPAPPVLLAHRGVSWPLTFSNAPKYRSRRVAGIIANSESVRDIIAESGRVPREKIAVIYGGIDEELFHPGVSGEGVREEFGIDREAPLVGIVGNVRPCKGHPYFFEAAARVAAQMPGARFLVVGNAHTEDFADQLGRLGLTERVVFTGFRADVPRLMAALDVSVNSSTDGEGLTGTLRESLAMGVPVVATRIAGNPEIVRHEENGLLVPPADPAALAQGITALLSAPEKARAMGARGRDLVQRRFTQRARCLAMEQLYLELLRRTPKKR